MSTQVSKLIQTLADLVRINSINPAYDGGVPEAAIASWIGGFFAGHGIETCLQEVFPGRPNLVARLPGKDSRRRILFEAHTDTASVTGMTIPPFEPTIAGGRLYGRGSCDTKSGLAAMMHALADLKHAGTQPPCDVWVVAAADEEHSYRGVLKLCEGLQAEAAVVAEPTGMKAVICSKGCLRLRIECHGRSAHSSRPELGVNAISHMARVIGAIEADSKNLPGARHTLVGSPTCNIGVIHGGTQINIVPDGCSIEIDRRLIPGETPDGVELGYAKILADLQQKDPEFDAQIIRLLADWPLETAADSPVARIAREALQAGGMDDALIGVPFGSDASKLAAAGVPSIVIGPGSIDQAHTPEEFVDCRQVEQAFEFYRKFMLLFE